MVERNADEYGAVKGVVACLDPERENDRMHTFAKEQIRLVLARSGVHDPSIAVETVDKCVNHVRAHRHMTGMGEVA